MLIPDVQKCLDDPCANACTTMENRRRHSSFSSLIRIVGGSGLGVVDHRRRRSGSFIFRRQPLETQLFAAGDGHQHRSIGGDICVNEDEDGDGLSRKAGSVETAMLVTTAAHQHRLLRNHRNAATAGVHRNGGVLLDLDHTYPAQQQQQYPYPYDEEVIL